MKVITFKYGRPGGSRPQRDRLCVEPRALEDVGPAWGRATPQSYCLKVLPQNELISDDCATVCGNMAWPYRPVFHGVIGSIPRVYHALPLYALQVATPGTALQLL
jgi:hypothetical protein